MKIILAEADPAFRSLLLESLERKLPNAVCCSAETGDALLRQVQALQPDLVVADLLLPGKDGMTALQAIREMPLPCQPELIVMSGYLSWAIQSEICALRPLFFTTLPCDVQVLTERIQACCREMVCRLPGRCGDEDQIIRRLLREVGMNPHSKGFLYAQTALQMLLDEPRRYHSLTKVLYPAVARKHGASAANVERAIRSAIVAAWEKEGFLRQRELFSRRPTNGEFLAVLAEDLHRARQFVQSN